MMLNIKVLLLLFAGIAGISGLAFEQATYSVESRLQRKQAKVHNINEYILVQRTTIQGVLQKLSRASDKAFGFASLDMLSSGVENGKVQFHDSCSSVSDAFIFQLDKNGIVRELNSIQEPFERMVRNDLIDRSFMGYSNIGAFASQEEFEIAQGLLVEYREAINKFSEAHHDLNEEAYYLQNAIFTAYAQLGRMSDILDDMVKEKIELALASEKLEVSRQLYALGSILASLFSIMFTLWFFRLFVSERP